jgi:archaellum component FlaG (FlaF/FlaG flagellin family)
MKNITLIISALILTSCTAGNLSNNVSNITGNLKSKMQNLSKNTPLQGIKDYQKKAWSKK